MNEKQAARNDPRKRQTMEVFDAVENMDRVGDHPVWLSGSSRRQRTEKPLFELEYPQMSARKERERGWRRTVFVIYAILRRENKSHKTLNRGRRLRV